MFINITNCLFCLAIFFFFLLQNKLTSQVINVNNPLAPADHIFLGVIKVWGAGNVKITEATLTSAGVQHELKTDHNLENQVSRL